MNEQVNEPTMEVFQPSALHALERAQIDTQVATAHQYPRSLELFKKRALSMATLDEETADSCIYVRPVGKKQVNGRWEMQYAEGASIRMAEIVAASYGNIRVASRVIEQTERFVKCEGVCHDLESNYAAKSEAMEPTVKTDGTPFSEGMRAVVAKATLAKAFRDAIFKVVPRALCKSVYDAAKKVAAGQGQPLEQRRKKAQAWIVSQKIEEARVFAALGVNGWSEVTDDHLLKLTGLKTAITDKEITADEAFPALAKTPDFGNTPKPEKPAKTPQDAPKTGVPTQTTSQTGNAAPAPSGEQQPPAKEPAKPAEKATEPEKAPETSQESPEDEEKALAEAGLAPEPKAEEAAPQGEPDPLMAAKPGDSDAVASVKLLCVKAGVSSTQLWGWLRSKKLAKENQKDLGELSTTKLDALCRTFTAKLPEIRSMPR